MSIKHLPKASYSHREDQSSDKREGANQSENSLIELEDDGHIGDAIPRRNDHFTEGATKQMNDQNSENQMTSVMRKVTWKK